MHLPLAKRADRNKECSGVTRERSVLCGNSQPPPCKSGCGCAVAIFTQFIYNPPVRQQAISGRSPDFTEIKENGRPLLMKNYKASGTSWKDPYRLRLMPLSVSEKKRRLKANISFRKLTYYFRMGINVLEGMTVFEIFQVMFYGLINKRIKKYFIKGRNLQQNIK